MIIIVLCSFFLNIWILCNISFNRIEQSIVSTENFSNSNAILSFLGKKQMTSTQRAFSCAAASTSAKSTKRKNATAPRYYSSSRRTTLLGSSAFVAYAAYAKASTATTDNDDRDDEKEKRALQIILDSTDDKLDLALPRNGKGCDLYERSKAVDDAVETLVALNRVDKKSATSSLLNGQADGVWEVFYAPHIERLSRPVGVKAKPLRYTLEKNRIVSDVSLTTNKPFETQSWWCASGSFTDSEKNPEKEEVLLKFTDFWVSLGSELPTTSPNETPGEADEFDKIVKKLGTIGFIEQLGAFPVLYYSEDVCVFRFPPLQSNIAARRVAKLSEWEEYEELEEDNSLDTHRSYLNAS